MVLPTLYEYYTNGGISSGLVEHETAFLLNGREFYVRGGSMDYFRVHPNRWRVEIKKMKAAGLNTVTATIPWSLHEPYPEMFEFGSGGTDFAEYLNVPSFVKTVREEDMLAIIRPRWLLKEEDIKVRSNDKKIMESVKRYFKVLLTILAAFQFTKGGPIIAFEIQTNGFIQNGDHSASFRMIYSEYNITEMLFSTNGLQTTSDDLLRGLKVNVTNTKDLKHLKRFQNDRPTLIIEYQTGYGQGWIHSHPTITSLDYAKGLYDIVSQNASFNIHGFHAGSNFGFIDSLLGENSNFNYDTPISECGDYTEKYFLTKSILDVYGNLKVRIPERPKPTTRIAHKNVVVIKQARLGNVLDNLQPIYKSKNGIIPMELLPINESIGQAYNDRGYTIYRSKNIDLPSGSKIIISGAILDLIMVLVNGKLIYKTDSYENYEESNLTVTTTNNEFISNATLDIIIENFGTNQIGGDLDAQYSGDVYSRVLRQTNVTVNNVTIQEWDVYILDFKQSSLDNITSWADPSFYDGWPTFNVGGFKPEKLQDSFIDVSNWNKGVVIVNGFVLSRYCKGGSKKTVYLPAPLLKKTWNEILIFEVFSAFPTIEFSEDPIIRLSEEMFY